MALHKKVTERRNRIKKNIKREFPTAAFEDTQDYIFIKLPFENTTITLELMTYSKDVAICRLRSMASVRGFTHEQNTSLFQRVRDYASTINTQIEGLAKNG